MNSTSAPVSARSLSSLLTPLHEHRLLLGLDVDGTLVNHDGDMSAAVHDALVAAREAGHEVVIATGRSLAQTLPIVRLAGVTDGWAVASNGAVTARITGPDTHHVTHTETFNPADALRALYQVVPTARFAIERADGTFFANESFAELAFGLITTRMSMDELMREKDVIRVVVTAPDMDRDEFSAIVSQAHVHGCQYAIGWSSWLDMSAPGVTKASALERLRSSLGIDPAHTVAIGDGPNDIEMLEWARVGIAMGQAETIVRNAATAITHSVHEDGAAFALSLLTPSQIR